MWQVVGQTRVVSLLKRSLEKKVVAHAYLFVGPPHVGKMTLALNLAQALNCEAAEPPCGECSSCQKIASAKPLNSHWDIESQRAKLLARLSHGCLGWALSAALDDGLLQQRAERMQRLLDIINADYEERFTYAAEMAAQFSRRREPIQEVLDLWLDWWRDLLLAKVGCNEAITNVDRLATLIDSARGYTLAQIKAFINNIQATAEQLGQNANPQLVLEVLMLSIPRRKESVSVKYD